MAPTSGILYVTMAPKPELPMAQFHDWYQNEHGPSRLRLPFVTNGFRYRATDLEGAGSGEPEWMAIYDITDMTTLVNEPYISLRKAPVQTQRERDTMKGIKVDRKFFDLVHEKAGEKFQRLEEVAREGEGNVMVTASVNIQPGKEEELNKWYEEEHLPLLSKVPGWRRSRLFITSSIEPKDTVEYLSLHEWAPDNGLDGAEFKAAVSTPWCVEIMTKVVTERKGRLFSLYYTFGPGPRDLQSLTQPEAVASSSTDDRTRSFPSTTSPAIESYVETADKAVLPYRLEGSTQPDAPLIVLTNSVLVEWGIWDHFVNTFLSKPENKKYRILRYSTRGRSTNFGKGPVTVDLLASDIITILDALRIPKAAAVIGVSLGGVTALRTAMNYPDRVAAFVACDTNANSPPSNRKAWGERIAMSESDPDAPVSETGARLVGEKLAEATVRRWFVKESYDGAGVEAEVNRVKKMVVENSLDGFKASVEALFGYDFRGDMKAGRVKGAFLVGSGDGVLPGTMKEMAAMYGDGARFEVIDGAGHLPMVEKPQAVADVVTHFLSE